MKKILIACLFINVAASSQVIHIGSHEIDSLYASLHIVGPDTTAYKMVVQKGDKFFRSYWPTTGTGSPTLNQYQIGVGNSSNIISGSSSLLFNNGLSLTYSTNDYGNSGGVNSGILLNNSAADGQTSLYSKINGTLRGKWRVGFDGSSNIISNGAGHYFWINGDYGDGGTVAMLIATDGITNNNTQDRILTINSSDKRLYYRDASSLGNSYTLPIASEYVLGGVMAGTGVSINSSGVISVSSSEVLTMTVTLDQVSIAAGGNNLNDVSFAGAVVGDVVVVAQNKDEPSLVYSAFVTSSGTVRVRVQNISNSAIDPDSYTFKIVVIK